MRKVVLWMHLMTGVVAAAIVFLMSVTGAALTYQRKLEDLARSEYRSDAPTPGVRPLDTEALVVASERPAERPAPPRASEAPAESLEG